jgi:hypothetical protein
MRCGLEQRAEAQDRAALVSGLAEYTTALPDTSCECAGELLSEGLALAFGSDYFDLTTRLRGGGLG